MSTNDTVLCYFKIPFTEERTTIKFSGAMTISQLYIACCGSEHGVLRNMFNIDPKYVIQLVEANSDKGEYGPTLLPNDNETIEQRYGNLKQPIPFYARPVNAETGEFIVREHYHIYTF